MDFIKYDLSNAKRFSLVIDEGLLYKFKHVAKKEGRSLNRQIFYIMRLCVEKFEREHGEIKA